MAEDSDQEKTEEPTSKRLEDARKKGQIARSREFNTFAMLLASAGLLLLLGKQMGNTLLKLMRTEFQISREVIFDPESPVIHLKQAMVEGVTLIAPFLAVMVIVAVLAPLTLGGWVFSWEAVMPKFSKLDPLKGIARMFALQTMVELGKGLLKLALISIVAYVLAKHFLAELIGLNAEPLEQSIGHALDIIGFSFLTLCASMIVVAIVDVPYQLYEHNKKLKMTLQEIKDEMKESEGSPEVKGRQRRAQMAMAQNRMMAEVPKADVIITNPTHFAVALKYDQNGGGAPKLIAKGADLIAAQIRSVATSSKIPFVEAPPLARALYYSTELDREIPKGLYLAVAQVLAYVYHLKTARENHWDEPLPPANIKVPDEFKQGI
jgi:flagellar biosynthesis protein FlhB